jgi:hypothetical protein
MYQFLKVNFIGESDKLNLNYRLSGVNHHKIIRFLCLRQYKITPIFFFLGLLSEAKQVDRLRKRRGVPFCIFV